MIFMMMMSRAASLKQSQSPITSGKLNQTTFFAAGEELLQQIVIVAIKLFQSCSSSSNSWSLPPVCCKAKRQACSPHCHKLA
jgi:hypothetical protein